MSRSGGVAGRHLRTLRNTAYRHGRSGAARLPHHRHGARTRGAFGSDAGDAEGRPREIRGFFARHLLLTRERGELATQLDVEAQADAPLAATMAIMALGRGAADAATIRNVATSADAALRAAGAQPSSG